MVGQGKWRVINGKWMTPSTSSSSGTTTDTSYNNTNSKIPDALKYGSLDRRILSKHRHTTRSANLSRTNSCENMEDALNVAASSLKRTSPVQLSKFRSNLGLDKKQEVNNNETDDESSNFKSSSNKVNYSITIFLYFFVINFVLSCFDSILIDVRQTIKFH